MLNFKNFPSDTFLTHWLDIRCLSTPNYKIAFVYTQDLKRVYQVKKATSKLYRSRAVPENVSELKKIMVTELSKCWESSVVLLLIYFQKSFNKNGTNKVYSLQRNDRDPHD